MERGHGSRKSAARGETPVQPLFHVAAGGGLHRLLVSQLVRVRGGFVTRFEVDIYRVRRYPARAFPGDTLCYLTGMAFAVVGIQAHFSKTLLLFFLPQIFNFLLSCPQLFGLVACPRHRVPRFDPKTNLLHPSTVAFERPPSVRTTSTLQLLSLLGLVRLTKHPKTGQIFETSNLTILNWLLIRLGPMTEKQLVQVLCVTQVAGSVLAFVIRYGLAGLVYDGDRR